MSDPVLITQRMVIRELAKRWRKQYPNGGYHDFKHVQGELDKLDLETVSAQEVNRLIGNDSWTSLTCDACDKEVLAVVQVGQEPDYESRTASLCAECLGRAVGAMIIQEPKP